MKAFAAMLALVISAGWGWADDAAKFAALEKHIVLIGQGNKFEIWDESRWKARCDEWPATQTGVERLSVELESISL